MPVRAREHTHSRGYLLLQARGRRLVEGGVGEGRVALARERGERRALEGGVGGGFEHGVARARGRELGLLVELGLGVARAGEVEEVAGEEELVHLADKKVDIRLPGKGNPNSHAARLVY